MLVVVGDYIAVLFQALDQARPRLSVDNGDGDHRTNENQSHHDNKRHGHEQRQDLRHHQGHHDSQHRRKHRSANEKQDAFGAGKSPVGIRRDGGSCRVDVFLRPNRHPVAENETRRHERLEQQGKRDERRAFRRPLVHVSCEVEMCRDQIRSGRVKRKPNGKRDERNGRVHHVPCERRRRRRLLETDKRNCLIALGFPALFPLDGLDSFAVVKHQGERYDQGHRCRCDNCRSEDCVR